MTDSLAPYLPYVLALVLPPGAFIVLLLIGLRQLRPRRGLGIALVLLACAGLWLGSTTGWAWITQSFVLRVPPALGPLDLDELKTQAKAQGKAPPSVAIVVLGGGLVPRSPDYRLSDLSDTGLQRLRYGLWLARQTGLPVAYSGGIPHGLPESVTPEARVAERIAREEYAASLRWVEDTSRDTRENAGRTAALLRHAGVRKIVLVTHVWHMPRAQRAFTEALAGSDLTIQPAPMGLLPAQTSHLAHWTPSLLGLLENRHAWREWLALRLGY
ncbi:MULTISPECIES: YdcF family protein [Caldimonas]|uniref:YdcF family protein n=1 Tax=Caldimonas TaxID=196013 RepID=UPI0003777E11|nr:MULTISPECIES: YdcF family protein [Caldimonas]MCX7659502.1 YdcF family protein [Caldimonas manganoxidans]GIX23454.1 MAG: membrane protein [Caldimonas sp.]